MMKQNIRFSLPVIAVQDVEVSKRFYRQMMGATIQYDFGINVAFHEGFSIQQEFGWLCGVPKQSIVYKAHNMELCFEAQDFDVFMRKLEAHPEIERIHPVKECSWKQRVIHFYDPDGHIIEVGEAMRTVVKTLLAQGNTPQQVAEITQHPPAFVQGVQNEEEVLP